MLLLPLGRGCLLLLLVLWNLLGRDARGVVRTRILDREAFLLHNVHGLRRLLCRGGMLRLGLRLDRMRLLLL